MDSHFTPPYQWESFKNAPHGSDTAISLIYLQGLWEGIKKKKVVCCSLSALLRWEYLIVSVKTGGFLVDLIDYWFSQRWGLSNYIFIKSSEGLWTTVEKPWDNISFLPDSYVPWFSHLTLSFLPPLLSMDLFLLCIFFDVFLFLLPLFGAVSLIPDSGCHHWLMKEFLLFIWWIDPSRLSSKLEDWRQSLKTSLSLKFSPIPNHSPWKLVSCTVKSMDPEGSYLNSNPTSTSYWQSELV